MRPKTLELTVEQRAELVRTRDRDRRPYLREIAAALVKVADGQTARHVALTGLGKSRKPDTVTGWVDRYAANGLAGVIHRPRRKPGISPPAADGIGRPRRT